MRKLEAFFAFLIATMAMAFAWMFADAKPSGTELLLGNYKWFLIIVLLRLCLTEIHNSNLGDRW